MFFESIINCLSDTFGRKVTTIALEVLYYTVQNPEGFRNLLSSLSGRRYLHGKNILLSPIVNTQKMEYIKERTALAIIRLVNAMSAHTRDNEERVVFSIKSLVIFTIFCLFLDMVSI